MVGKLPICIAAFAAQIELGRGNPLQPHFAERSTMGRKKAKQLNMRISEKDYEAIVRRAERAKVCISAFILTMTLKGEIIVIEGLPEIAKELRYIGNNINQLTRLCHDGQITCLELEAVKGELARIWRSLNLQIQKAV